jgi:DNA-binding LacI/PurR family transcriptional regulator
MPRRKKEVSIYTISRELKLSPSTVSKALNSYPEISAEVRERVRSHAEKRSFNRTRFSRTVPNICLLMRYSAESPVMFSPYVTSVAEGAAAYTWANKLELSIFGGTAEGLNEMDITRELLQRKVDGAIVMLADNKCQYIEKLASQRFPFVCLQTDDGKEGRPLIRVDNRAIAFKAISYLLELGHREIAIINAHPRSLTAKLRIEGYMEAHKAYNIPVRQELIFEQDQLRTDLLEIGYQTANRILQRFPEVTAVFVFNHHTAVGALHGFKSKGVRVPEDISIISSDNFPATAYYDPPLTVIDMPNEDMGRLAAQYLHGLITKQDPPADALLSTHLRADLVIRDSTGPVRGRR